MKEILLINGGVALISDEDYVEISKYNWRKKRDGKTYYAYRNYAGKMISMHRQILNTPIGMQVNHKDWNGLNNQRENIQNCTPNDNCRWIRPRSNTGFLGVSKHITTSTNGTKHTYYTADIKCNGIIYRLYHGKDVNSAARAYDVKAKELFGEFANCNFK